MARTSLILLLIAALAGAGCGASEGSGTSAGSADEREGGKPAKVRIGFQTIPNGAPIVKHHRWLEKALGVPVEWISFDSGANVNRAVASGSVDIGLAGSSPVANGIASDLPYKVAWIYDVIGDNEQLVVKRDAGVSGVAGLAGKKVAAPFGSTTHYSLLTALVQAGVKPDDVDLLDMEPDDIVAAWERDDIDAAYVWTPSLAKLREDGGRVLVSSAQLARQGTLTGDLGVVRNGFAEKYPDAVAEWVRQEDRAVALYRSQPEKAAAAVAAEFSIPRREAASQMKELIWLDAGEQASAKYLGGDLAKQLEKTARFLKEQKIIDRAPEAEEFRSAVDARFAARVGR